MNKTLLLSTLATLTLGACDQTLPTAAPGATAPQGDSLALFAQRLWDCHSYGNSASATASDRANAAKTSPADTIDLLPRDVVVPANTVITWRYLDEPTASPIDPANPPRVPLRNGVVVMIDGTNYWTPHSAAGLFDLPTITPGSQTLDFFADSIAITSLRPGTRIHYTLDGTYPTSSSPLYTGKIPLDRPYLVRAMAEVPGQGISLATATAYPAALGWNPGVAYDTLVDARDGQAYPTVHLGSQIWMAKNLDWSAPGESLRDGREGAAYTADQVQAGGLCPEGWSVPSRADWDSLEAWGTRQQGVTKANFGNALRSTALLGSMQPYDAVNHVDLFGFRATSASFWTRTPGDDSGTVVLRAFSEGSLVESVQSTMSGQWISAYGQETYFHSGPTLSRVRCLKDAP